MRPLFVLTLVPAALHAQAGSDIYLAPVPGAGVDLSVSMPVNVTARPGYDNQPSFTPDGRAILYTSIRDDGQADTYRYDLARRTTTRVTYTSESEYSPTVIPGGTHFSVVRVEADSTQRLWRFAPDGTDPTLVLADVQPVGYHAWGDAHTLGLFVLGDPPTLQLADTRTGTANVVAQDVGRSLHKIPGRAAISFLHRRGPEPASIKIIELDSRTIELVAPALEGNEYYAWMPDGTLVMGAGSKLFRWDTGTDGWTEIADHSRFGVTGISRLAVSPSGDILAIVGNDGSDGIDGSDGMFAPGLPSIPSIPSFPSLPPSLLPIHEKHEQRELREDAQQHELTGAHTTRQEVQQDREKAEKQEHRRTAHDTGRGTQHQHPPDAFVARPHTPNACRDVPQHAAEHGVEPKDRRMGAEDRPAGEPGHTTR